MASAWVATSGATDLTRCRRIRTSEKPASPVAPPPLHGFTRRSVAPEEAAEAGAVTVCPRPRQADPARCRGGQPCRRPQAGRGDDRPVPRPGSRASESGWSAAGPHVGSGPIRVAGVRPIVGVIGSLDGPLHFRKSAQSLVIVTAALLPPLATTDTLDCCLIGVAAGCPPLRHPVQQPIRPRALAGNSAGPSPQSVLRRPVGDALGPRVYPALGDRPTKLEATPAAHPFPAGHRPFWTAAYDAAHAQRARRVG